MYHNRAKPRILFTRLRLPPLQLVSQYPQQLFVSIKVQPTHKLVDTSDNEPAEDSDAIRLD